MEIIRQGKPELQVIETMYEKRMSEMLLSISF